MSSRPEAVPSPDEPVGAKRPSLVTHYLRYSLSNGMVLLAGFISFPILTRLLDNAEFGILRYYETLMLFGVSVIKLGAPHAIVRFYPYDGDPKRVPAFGTNLVVIPLMLSFGLWAIAFSGLVLWSQWRGTPAHPVFWCALLMIPLMSSSNIVQMVVRARERSDIVMATRILGRVLELVMVLGAVVFVQQSALSVFGGKLIATAILLAWLLHWMRRNVHVAREAIDFQYFRSGLIYGLPMMAHELAFSVLVNIDRVLLKELTGDFAMVGIYAIGYSLAMQVNIFMSATLSEAFLPVVNRAFETGGAVAVRALKERVLLPMTYAVVAIVAMLLVSGQDLLVALSGPAKAASGPVFVVVGITVSLYALFAISNYGLLLKKRTMPVLVITLGAAVLNVAANFFLIPRMGYMGAAWATALSYAALIAAQFVTCPKGLSRFANPRTIAVAVTCAAVLVGVAQSTALFGLPGVWSRLFAAGGLLVVLYVVPILLLDPKLRVALLALRTRSP